MSESSRTSAKSSRLSRSATFLELNRGMAGLLSMVILVGVVVPIAAFGGAFLWLVSPTANFLTAFGFGVAETEWFAAFGKAEPAGGDGVRAGGEKNCKKASGMHSTSSSSSAQSWPFAGSIGVCPDVADRAPDVWDGRRDAGSAILLPVFR